MSNHNLPKIMTSLKDIYNKNAEVFFRDRDKSLFEKTWLDIFIAELPHPELVLDAGCGTGDPIARYLLRQNVRVKGIDFSKEMISLAKIHLPDLSCELQDMRELHSHYKFSGIIAWNSFFHLNFSDQLKTLSLFGDYLVEDGVFLFTAGPDKGKVWGKVGSDDVYHWSYSFEEYIKELELRNFEIIQVKLSDHLCNDHSVYLSKKRKNLY